MQTLTNKKHMVPQTRDQMSHIPEIPLPFPNGGWRAAWLPEENGSWVTHPKMIHTKTQTTTKLRSHRKSSLKFHFHSQMDVSKQMGPAFEREQTQWFSFHKGSSPDGVETIPSQSKLEWLIQQHWMWTVALDVSQLQTVFCHGWQSLWDLWSKMGSGSCWGFREGADPGQGWPSLGTDS